MQNINREKIIQLTKKEIIKISSIKLIIYKKEILIFLKFIN